MRIRLLLLLKQCKGLSKFQLLPQGQRSLPHFAVRSIPEGISVQIHRKVTKVPTGVVYHLLPTLPMSPLGEMTFAKETVGKQFGFSLTVPVNHLQFFILKEALLSAQLCFQPNRKLWGQMGKSFPWELFRFPQCFRDIFQQPTAKGSSSRLPWGL